MPWNNIVSSVSWLAANASTLLHPKEDKGKFNGNNLAHYDCEVPAKKFHLSGHTAGFCLRTQELEAFTRFHQSPFGEGSMHSN